MPRTLRPATALIASFILAGCGARVETPPASLKDSPARLVSAVANPDVPAAFVIQPSTVKIVVHGGLGLTKVDLDLAMSQALRRRGYTIVTGPSAWTVTGSVETDKINWSVTDAAGTPHAIISQAIPKPGEIRGADAVSAAASAATSVARIIPSQKGEKL